MRKATLFVVAFLVIAGFSGTALAWSGHDQIGYRARAVASYSGGAPCSDWNGYLYSQAGWADWPEHTTGSSTYYDREYNHRSCYGYGDMAHFVQMGTSICGTGDGHTNAQGFFNTANFYNGILGGTSTSRKVLGRGQHYIQDAGNPWHSSMLMSACHASVESWMSSNFNSSTYRFYQDVASGASNAKYNASATTNKSALTRNAAYQGWYTGYWLSCSDYSASYNISTWHSLMWWVGYYNFAYYKPICS